MPLAADLRRALFELVLGSNFPPRWDAVPLEAVLASFSEAGVNSYLRAFEGGQPSMSHRTVARLRTSGLVRAVITTNFDSLIEVAARDEFTAANRTVPMLELGVLAGDPDINRLVLNPRSTVPQLVKMHGSVEVPGTIRATVGQLTRPTSRESIAKLMDFVFVSGPHDCVIVVGYSGHDEYDINPALHATPPPTKRVFYVRHKSQEDSSPESKGEVPEFSDDIFVSRASDIVEADTSTVLADICAGLGWSDLQTSGQSSPTDHTRLEKVIETIGSELDEGDGLRRKLLAASLRECVVNMLALDQPSSGVSDSEFRLLALSTVGGYELAIAKARRLERPSIELLAHFSLARFIRAHLEDGEENYLMAVGHARMAQDLAAADAGERGAWYLRSSLLSAAIEESHSHDARLQIPEYKRIYTLAKREALSDEVSISAYWLARALCASGDIAAGGAILVGELPLIESSGRTEVLLAAYFMLRECEFWSGRPAAAREYGRKVIALQLAEGAVGREALERELAERERGGLVREVFDYAILPEPPLS